MSHASLASHVAAQVAWTVPRETQQVLARTMGPPQFSYTRVEEAQNRARVEGLGLVRSGVYLGWMVPSWR